MRKIIRYPRINVHEGKGAPEKLENNYDKIHGEVAQGSVSKSSKKRSLYRTTGHTSFRPFGGIDDDLTDPVSTLVSWRASANRR